MFGFDLQLKPVGSSCNLDCKYPCYAKPFKTNHTKIMGSDVLDKAIKGCLEEGRNTAITYHGGEPTLAGIEFYRNLQKIIEKYKKPGQVVTQKMQTNATLMNEEFAQLLFNSGFLIGVSIDGPEHIHGINRTDLNGNNSFSRAMEGLSILRQAGFEPSVIATITKKTLKYVDEVFDFLIENGFKEIQFSPVYDPDNNTFNISSDKWFKYLERIFDLWYQNGDPEISIVDIDEVLAWMNPEIAVPLCSSNQGCINWVSIDPDGSIYPCAYFKSSMPYGNINEIDLKQVINIKTYQNYKKLFLTPPKKCSKCSYFKMCGNGCVATRLKGNIPDPTGIYVYCQERISLYEKIRDLYESD
ncbi:MAG: radical SAM protein [Patescibacteria group bacterium]